VIGAPTWRCARCGGPLELGDDTAAEVAPSPGLHTAPPTSGLWRYLDRLPVRSPVTLGEPATPLVEARIGGREVLLKLESALPTGSFKDRGSAVLVAWLRDAGIDRVVEDSSGNAGASLAAYAARAGITARIMVPESASPAKLVQARAFGAEVVLVPGPRQAATDAAIAAAEKGWFYASHLWSPLCPAGTATWAWELTDQVGGELPDAVVVPLGGGTLLLGLARGFTWLRRAGVATRTPRLYGIQSRACAPLAAAFAAGKEAPAPVEPRPSMAEGILLARPPRGGAILARVRESGGTIVAVEDAAAWTSLHELARAGILAEPTSAVALAGVTVLERQGELRPTDRVVVAITGSGLKAADRIAATLS
jgi:threonine synthase